MASSRSAFTVTEYCDAACDTAVRQTIAPRMTRATNLRQHDWHLRSTICITSILVIIRHFMKMVIVRTPLKRRLSVARINHQTCLGAAFAASATNSQNTSQAGWVRLRAHRIDCWKVASGIWKCSCVLKTASKETISSGFEFSHDNVYRILVG